MTNTLMYAMEAKWKLLVIFLDLDKAFDMVAVSIPIDRFDKVGARGVCLQLFKNYLWQRVKISQITNDPKCTHLVGGVAGQGS